MYWKEHEWERAGTTLNLSVQSEKWGRPLKHLVLHYNLVIKKKKRKKKKIQCSVLSKLSSHFFWTQYMVKL